jgi:hypothetical protein
LDPLVTDTIQPNLNSPFDFPIDPDASWSITEKRDLWDWIGRNIPKAVSRAEAGNPLLQKFIDPKTPPDRPDIGVTPEDLKFLDSLRISKNFTSHKRPPPTTIPTDSRQFSKYQKATVEDHPMENRTGYTPAPSSPTRDFIPESSTTRAPEPPTPGPSNTIPTVNKNPAPTMQIPLPNFNRTDYRSFS